MPQKKALEFHLIGSVPLSLEKDSPPKGNNQIGAELTSIKQGRFIPLQQRLMLDPPAARRHEEETIRPFYRAMIYRNYPAMDVD
jgi:hypothetical protein